MNESNNFIVVVYRKNIIELQEYSEEQIFNCAFSDTAEVYECRNIIFDSGFIKFSGRKVKRFTSRSRNIEEFSEFNEYFRIRHGFGGASNTKFKNVPIELMEKHYNRFINMGAVEREQDNLDSYTFNTNILLYKNYDKPFRKMAFSGNLIFKGATHDIL